MTHVAMIWCDATASKCTLVAYNVLKKMLLGVASMCIMVVGNLLMFLHPGAWCGVHIYYVYGRLWWRPLLKLRCAAAEGDAPCGIRKKAIPRSHHPIGLWIERVK